MIAKKSTQNLDVIVQCAAMSFCLFAHAHWSIASFMRIIFEFSSSSTAQNELKEKVKRPKWDQNRIKICVAGDATIKSFGSFQILERREKNVEKIY